MEGPSRAFLDRVIKTGLVSKCQFDHGGEMVTQKKTKGKKNAASPQKRDRACTFLAV